MAQINKPNTHFNSKLFTGTGSTQSITGVGFQPDLTWFKSRTLAESHNLVDSVRGLFRLRSNSTSAQVSTPVTLDSDGFTVGSESENNGGSMVAWNWKGGGTAASNTDGSITSSVSANTTAGFSIVSYTGTGSNATIGHGLGVAPSMVINKPRDITSSWSVYHAGIASDAETDVIYLEGTGAAFDNSTFWNDTAPNSSVFSVGSATGTGANIAYCFAEKKGFSKFGSYVGNGNADGTFVYTGFKPSFVMLKSSSNVTEWIMHDNDRLGYNGGNQPLFPNNSGAEDANSRIDLLSNGFKLKDSSIHWNGSGYSFIYMAFAENPLVGTNGIPATAR